MTKKFLVPVDFTKNELQNAVAQSLASAPGTPIAGQFYYDTGTNKFMWRNNAAWVDALARATHTGTQLAATISDFDTQVRTSRLDQMAVPTVDVSFNSRKITNLLDGVGAQDAVTKLQLDTVANGRDFKDAVRAATTGNITLSAPQTIDGVGVIAGERVLVKDQTTASQNGPYQVNAGAWTRTTDADTSAKVTAGMSFFVEEGTVNGDKQYTLTTNNPIVLNTTALVFGTTGAGTTYTGSGGVTVAGSIISLDLAVAVRKFAAAIGDNSAVSIAVTHSLNTLDVTTEVYEVSTGAKVECDVLHNSTSQVTLGFAVAPTTGQYRVVVHG